MCYITDQQYAYAENSTSEKAVKQMAKFHPLCVEQGGLHSGMHQFLDIIQIGVLGLALWKLISFYRPNCTTEWNKVFLHGTELACFEIFYCILKISPISLSFGGLTLYSLLCLSVHVLSSCNLVNIQWLQRTHCS